MTTRRRLELLARAYPRLFPRADLLRRLGKSAEAAEAYRRALGLATNDVERRFLRRRLAQLPTQ